MSEWFGELPERWGSKRIGALLQQRKETNDPVKTDFILSLSAAHGVVPYSERVEKGGNKPKNDLTKYSIAHENDLLVNCMNVLAGSSGVSKWYGAISPVYYALHPRNADDINIWYYNYIFRLVTFYRSLIGISKGILVHESSTGSLNTIRLRVAMQNMKYVMMPLPSRNEQDQIVRYLDWKMSLINKLINAKKKQITLLQEQRRSLINKSVTKGTNPDAQMVDSGFSWLGAIPSEWHIRSFSKIAKVCSNLVDPADHLDLPQVSPANIEKNTGRLLSYQTVREAGIISNNHRFNEGQIIYSKIRPMLNKVTIAPFDGLCSADMYPIETKLMTRYLFYYILSDTFLSQLTMTGNRVKMPKINQDELSGIMILCPPDKEQKEIVSYLDKQCECIDRLITKLNDELTLFAEYRTRLISDVVTGKLDVRDAVIPNYEAVEETVVVEDVVDDSFEKAGDE